MSEKVLITGGSGTVGRALSQQLDQLGYKVSWLSRYNRKSKYALCLWNPDKHEIDEGALSGISTVFNLAGAGIADKRWSEEYKRKIIDSRLNTVQTLEAAFRTKQHKVTTLVSASAIGIYDSNKWREWHDETMENGSDFLAVVTRQWEDALDRIAELGIRVVKIRIGIVLSNEGGAFKSMMTPIKFGFGAPLASGKQPMSWIHIDDLCRLFIHLAQDDSFHGAFNGVAPNPVTNEDMTAIMAKHKKRPLWLPNVPAFVMKLVLGEMATMVLGGTKVSSRKTKQTGFEFKFPELDAAVKDLVK